MPTNKPKNVATMTKVEYTRMRSAQKKGVLQEIDVTRFPRAFSYLVKEDKEAIYLGYELETYIPHEGDRISQSLIAAIIARTKYGALCNFRQEYYATFEMVSIPATLNFHRKSIEELLDIKGFTSRDNNGMHVHVSKTSFKDRLHLSKFIVFVNLTQNREFIETIAGRTLNHYCAPNPRLNIRYQDKPDRFEKVPVRVSITFDDTRGTLTLDDTHGTGKECAINTAPPSTVELRIFKAPTDKDKIISNLEFTEALVKFSLEKEITDLTVDTFVKYVDEHKNVYKYLYKDIKPLLPKSVVKKPVAVKKVSAICQLDDIGSSWFIGMPRLF